MSLSQCNVKCLNGFYYGNGAGEDALLLYHSCARICSESFMLERVSSQWSILYMRVVKRAERSPTGSLLTIRISVAIDYGFHTSGV